MFAAISGSFVKKSGDVMTGDLYMGLNKIFLTDGVTGGVLRGSGFSADWIEIRRKTGVGYGNVSADALNLTGSIVMDPGSKVDGIDISDMFGADTVNDTDTNPLAAGNTYKALADGFVTYNTVQGSNAQIVELLSDSSNPPVTAIAHTHGDWGEGSLSVSKRIKKNDYWKITLAGGATISHLRWQPIGTGGSEKQ